MPSWVKGYNPELIAKKMEAVKKVSKEGKVSFEGFQHSEHVVILNSMLQFSSDVPEIEIRRIINKATFNAGERGEITAKSILVEAGKLEREYQGAKPEKYRLITSISISRTCSLSNIRIDGVGISINPKLSKSVQKSRDGLLKDAKHSIAHSIPSGYADVSVSVLARSTGEAANKALDQLDFIRGIWNLWKNRGQNTRMSSGLRKPVNKIILGPLHTLHKPNGSLATESWWYEPQYQGPVDLYYEQSKIELMYKFMATFRRYYGKSTYRQDIMNAVLRYVRALDSRDWDDAFLKLWGVLELLTGTLHDSYKVTVRRASFMYKDREYAQQVLSHLKDYRNKSVHAGSSSNHIESLMYQLKRYVEALLEFHVGNRYGFDSIKDASDVMDLPNDPILLDSKIRKLKYTKKFITN